MDVVTLLLAAEAGAVTGFLVGSAFGGKLLGLGGHALLGALGGLAGGWALQVVALLPAPQASVAATITHVAISGLVGGTLTLLARGVLRLHRKCRRRSLPPPHPSSHR